MVGIPALWLSILLAAVLVFVVSSIIHMFLPYHRTDYGKFSNEDAVMDALRPLDLPAGEWVVPSAEGRADVMKSDDFRAKVEKGPVLFMTVLPKDDPFAMGAQLVQWFVYCIIVSIFAAYITGRALGPGAEYYSVFRFAGATAFCAYGLAVWQRTIWFHQKASTSLKTTFDSLIYALVTAGAFAGFWPG